MASKRSLTPKQARFAQEYLIDFNGTQAAIRAGYSPKTASIQSFDLLRKPNIQETIKAGCLKLAEKSELTVQWVLDNLKEISQRCMEKTPVMRRQGREMVQVENVDGEGVWEFDSAGANRSLELIGKHIGMFIERVQDVTPALPVRVIIQVDDDSS